MGEKHRQRVEEHRGPIQKIVKPDDSVIVKCKCPSCGSFDAVSLPQTVAKSCGVLGSDSFTNLQASVLIDSKLASFGAKVVNLPVDLRVCKDCGYVMFFEYRGHLTAVKSSTLPKDEIQANMGDEEKKEGKIIV